MERAEEVFKKLKAIYVSHLHADHHIGEYYQTKTFKREVFSNITMKSSRFNWAITAETSSTW